ncbi:PQQ-dependent sugar dehydrogenase [Halovivax limisalsi]|uniref:PQQ-dependent sugar dehydrogenase n=1 Tax=Halovivax limisalsi TaxID=1453760 RepID=UPI001FFD0C8F|nr:PQQ-dependent sugar dehydrogenase [Halovivax limisalsi]
MTNPPFDPDGPPCGRDGQRSRTDSSRRVFMKAAAATGAAVSLTGPAIAQDENESGGTETNGEDESTGPSRDEIVGEGPTIGLERVAGGFTAPVGFEVAPGQEDRFYVVDQLGQIRVIEPATADGDAADGEAGTDAETGDGTDEGNVTEDGNESTGAGAAGNETGGVADDNESDGAGDGAGNGASQGGTDSGEMQLRAEPFLDLSDRIVEVSGGTGEFDERGLLGLAFHPDFRENGRFFVRYSAPPTDDTPEDYDHTAILAEFSTASDDHETGDPDSEEILLEVPEPQFNHNAGAVLFGPDDYLYVPFGDGGNANDVGLGHVEDWYDANEGGNGQNTTENLLGGILRIDVDAEGDDGRPYGIPDDNPLVDSDEGMDEYFAWGLRNPWRASFDGEGRFFVADVGQNLFEEVDIVENGGNYGWNVKEGIECFSTENPGEPPEECPSATPDDVRGGEPLIDPVIQYPHLVEGETLGISITGGYVYEGDSVTELQETYVYGDWSSSFGTPDGSLFASPVREYEATADRSRDDLWEIQELSVSDAENDRINRFVLAFGRDHDDELYVLTTARYTDGETGEVWRIVPDGEGESIEPHPDGVGMDDDDGDDGDAETEDDGESGEKGAENGDDGTGSDDESESDGEEANETTGESDGEETEAVDD